MNGVDLTVWDVLTAAVISNLNTLLLGERGEGKTQLQNDLKNSYFGGKVTYIRMRDSLRVKDLFEVYNIGKLLEGKGTVLEAKEKTRAISNPMTLIDEINRAHEKVQNQVFDICDGYIIFDGPNGPEKIQLGVPIEGKNYFHAVVASANIGAARYTGTSPIDPALLDRSHLILNVDQFSPTAIDHSLILAEATSPKVIEYQNSDHTADIIEIHRGVNGVKLSLDAMLALVYVKKGLSHCLHKDNPSHSKESILKVMPAFCEGCNELGKGCGYTFPASVRTMKATALLARGLKVVADSKSDEIQTLRVRHQDVLEAFTLVAPYAGMLDSQWVDKEFFGNDQYAIKKISETIAKDMKSLSPRMKKAFTDAQKGELTKDTKDSFTNRWGWFGDVLAAFNTAAKKADKNLMKLTLEERTQLQEKFPILRWLE